jgi:hypothetical protein
MVTFHTTLKTQLVVRYLSKCVGYQQFRRRCINRSSVSRVIRYDIAKAKANKDTGNFTEHIAILLFTIVCAPETAALNIA